jgi:uncharacterized membrane protein YqjE
MNNPAIRATGQLGEYASAGRPEARTIGEIMGDIVAHAQEIIRSEIQLAKTELRQEGAKAVQAGIISAVGATIGLFGLGFLLLACVYALSIVMPNWAAALIVGFMLVVVAGICVMLGRERWQAVHKPDRTIGEMKENVQWLKHPTKS